MGCRCLSFSRRCMFKWRHSPQHLPFCSVRAKQFSRGRWMRFTFECSQMSRGG
jgi:endogenous inhibitor of DNA gyrase (YacG/DUF329 family)